ncbi:hypothetical protein [Desulfosporosinus lacus]|uniref:Uncharacterized protein n=1 Tax=Desulfosporosinus lacus DSM 15449 TaxID=1121420 RepID=A0A1M5WER7_9FIRM|nr:hypothetical protein [Desulfosporosinus lacus]SHH85982.1 hypothetical protein SAMN02746098_01585 [Desulfosporosinus lacus DSM 15449]
MKPYYDLDLTTRNRIIGLIKQCEISNLGNVSFEYYPTPRNEAKTFHMEQNNLGWELVVSERRSGTRDVYEIVGDQITYDYSEKD